MILDSTRPIDLSHILHVQTLFADVMYIDLPAGRSAFEHPKGLRAIEEAVGDFPGSVEDRVEHEEEIRRGLCWLLHQDDDGLAQVPDLILASPLLSDHRRYFELLWEGGFADWRSKEFDAALYGRFEQGAGGVPVLADPLMPIDFRSVFGLLREPVAGDADRAYADLLGRAAEEDDARLGLWWLLSQDDVTLGEVLDRAGAVFPAGVDDRRAQLQRLWDRLFADWRVEGFDLGDYQVTGLAG